MEDLNPREKEIIDLVSENASISSSEISRKIGVSSVTVRHYLNTLSDKGLIVRNRGGALPAFHPGILERQRLRLTEKKGIAKTAAMMVKDNDTIMIEAGTTTSLIAKYLLGKRDVHVVTNSALVIPFARLNPSLHLTLIGGDFQTETESFIGPTALEELERFHVRLAFLGTDGFSIKTGFTAHHLGGAEIVKKMAEQSRTAVVVADSSKYGRTGFVNTLPLKKAGLLITDSGLNTKTRAELERYGIKFRITG